eukprot:CAMPEP_0171886388 /NCGR_PEP_ID=MMETSP0992-20121227/41867_1 /TAXON_ID=483369 /ORGANISM="non described non described, Strain CCMP2098" /LENGTH=56 /DNA_ID=CAMNT_0012513029 /DNA_START=115 /DNA_END=282 /DNA_ORIENTATION=+
MACARRLLCSPLASASSKWHPEHCKPTLAAMRAKGGDRNETTPEEEEEAAAVTVTV